ncbi:periphilin-1 isoform X1 [Gambusia affinis]|uniref:periphilin-1 isoform X1 n=1 Tax=Gambusia affinis TaxID=33528 RepID=UPI000F30EB26|nr:periphilin-1 isoform X1 [Gambusia affinis]
MSHERAAMDHARAPETQESKADKRLTGSTASPAEIKKRPIRRVRSPSAPRAWLSRSYKPKFGGPVYKPRFPGDHHSFHKAGFHNQHHHYLKHRPYVHRKDYPPPKPWLLAMKEKEKQKQREKEKEKEREKQHHEQRESTERSSPSKQNASRPVLPRSTSSRDKDMQITEHLEKSPSVKVFQNEQNQSRERDHRERSRDGELPLTASQTAARDRAIQQKRREIDEVYNQECEMFGLVAKMLIAKDPSLERPIQFSLQENLRDIGKRCVDAMEKFIEDYDSRKLLH